MHRLYFTPVINIIDNNYFVCPEAEAAWERIIFKTDKLGAFLLTLLQDNITCEEMASIAEKEFPQETQQDILNKAIKVKNTVSSLSLEENTLEVVEI